MSDAGLAAEDLRIVDARELGRWKARRALSQLHREVLAPSFAPEELCTRRELLQDVLGRAATSRAYLAFDPAGAVVAGLVADFDPDTRVGLVAYFAVRPGLRGRGLGSSVEAAFAVAFVAEVGPALVLGELQDPRVHAVDEHQDPVARVRLYHRMGIRQVDLPYAMPKLRPEDERIPGTVLAVYHVDPSVGSDSVPSDLLARYLRRYVVLCEGEEALAADPDLVRMFAHLAATDEVALLPLLDLLPPAESER